MVTVEQVIVDEYRRQQTQALARTVVLTGVALLLLIAVGVWANSWVVASLASLNLTCWIASAAGRWATVRGLRLSQ